MYSVIRLGSLMSTNLVGHHRRVLEGISADLGRAAEWVDAESLDEVDLVFSCGLPVSLRLDEWTVAAAPVARGQHYGGRPVYFTFFVIAADQAALDFDDVVGLPLVMNEPGSHSGYAAVLAELAGRDLDLSFFGSWRFSGGHMISLESVLMGSGEVAAIDSLAFDGYLAENPAAADLLRVVTVSQPWPAPPLALRRSLDDDLRPRIEAAICGAVDGGGIPGVERFEPVSDERYRVLAENWSRVVPHDEIVPADGPGAG